jgi:hypothetical protein
MVNALRTGPPPMPPTPPNRAPDASRLPDLARNLMSPSGGAGLSKAEGSSPVQAAASISSAAVSRPQPESDPSRPVRTPRPGSLLDIRV